MNSKEPDIRRALRERADLLSRLDGGIEEKLRVMTKTMVDCLQKGGAIYACGNGGSATQAQHFAAELVGRFKMDRSALRVFALSDNVAAMTSIANDYDYADVFARQIAGMGKRGDCLLALSTSGRSENVVRACRAGRRQELAVFGLTGEDGGEVAASSNVAIEVPHSDSALIQEMHLALIHLICQLVEAAVFSGQPTSSS